ncbi:hypothetical protein JTB14_012747 [Gonioctena quinquepunctata]|nr:hypothetical protein JTB14_012747 [Gonioctena quinquepunctata]
MITKQPLPIIEVGEEIVIGSGRNFPIDGRESMNLNVPHEQNGSLTYGWSCDVMDKARADSDNTSLRNGMIMNSTGQSILLAARLKFIEENFPHQHNCSRAFKWENIFSTTSLFEGFNPRYLFIDRMGK